MKKIKIISLAVLITWSLTLGIYVFKTITIWPSESLTGDGWEEFFDGKSDHCINVSIYPTEREETGIPLLFLYTVDSPPCRSRLIFNTSTDIGIEDFELTSLTVTSVGRGTTESISVADLPDPDIYQDTYNDIEFMRAVIELPEIMHFDFPLKIEYQCKTESNGREEVFEGTVLNKADWNTSVHLGWFLQLLKWSGV